MMEHFIKAFEETKVLIDVIEQSRQQDDVVNQMYTAICDGCCVCEIAPNTTATAGVNLGEAAAFLTATLGKLRGSECYTGPCITQERLAIILALVTLDSSKYIRRMARELISFIVQENQISSALSLHLVQQLAVYTQVGEETATWVWDCLLKLCPLSEDAFLGSMIGQCVGDALGFLVEKRHAKVCKAFVDEFVLTNTIPTLIRIEGLTFGQYSDDSQLARETYVSLIQAGGKLDPVVYGLRIGCLFQPDHYRIIGYGYTTACAGKALFMGKHYSTTGSLTASGNGSAMRSGPIGLLLSRKPLAQVVETARLFSSITHASDACKDGSVAIAVGTRAAMATRTIPFDVDRFVAHIASFIGTDDYKAEILNLPALLIGASDDAAKTHIIAYGDRMDEMKWERRISPGVRQSSLWALYSFCKYPDDYVNCIATSIACGGDVDTTAAMAGALVGSRLGYAHIPPVWRDTLHDLEDWKLEDLTALVKTAYELVATDSVCT